VEAASKLIRDAAPAVTVTTKIIEAVPKDMIVQEARDWGADLIVLGSHGYGRVRGMVLGSVASAVVAKAPCSVKWFVQSTFSTTRNRPRDWRIGTTP